MLKRIAVGLIFVGAVLTACGSAVAHGVESIAQPTELQPPDGEVPVLYPPDGPHRGEAAVVLFVDEVPVGVAWQQVRGITAELGGWVSKSSTGLGMYEGERYEYVAAVVDIPEYRFEDFIVWLDELGERIHFDYQTLPAVGSGTVTVDVTLTDSVDPFVGIDSLSSSTGRLERALDTAGDVLLTILSVVIIAGAVVVPIGVMALFGFVVWRWMRRRWPIAELPPAPTDTDEADETLVDSPR